MFLQKRESFNNVEQAMQCVSSIQEKRKKVTRPTLIFFGVCRAPTYPPKTGPTQKILPF